MGLVAGQPKRGGPTLVRRNSDGSTQGDFYRSAFAPLNEWVKHLLGEARRCTGSITAHISLWDATNHMICMYAEGQHAAVYSKTRPAKQGVTTVAARTKKPVMITDVRQTKEWHDAMREAVAFGDEEYKELLNSFHSEIALPLFASDGADQKRVVAVINLHHPVKGGLTASSLRTLKRLCKGAAQAIENAVFEAAMQGAGAQFEMQEAIRRICEQAQNAGVGQPSLWDLVLQEGARLARADVAGLWTHYEPKHEFHLVSYVSFSAAHYTSYRAPDTKGLKSKVFQSGTPYYCDKTDEDPDWIKCIEGIQTCYVLPIRRNGNVIGVLCLDSFRLGAFSAALCQTLQTFAEVCSHLISRRLAEIEIVVREHWRVSLATATSESELYRRALRAACYLTGAEGASLFFRRGAGESASLALASSTGLAPEYSADSSYALDETAGITPWVSMNRVPLRLRNCGDKAELRRWGPTLRWKGQTREVRSSTGFKRAHLSVPVGATGVFRLSGKNGPGGFKEEDKVALMELVKLLMSELNGPRAVLSVIAAEIKTQPDRDSCLTLILDRCIELSGAEAGTIFFLDGDVLINCAARGGLLISKADLNQTIHGNSVTGLCARYKATQVVDDVNQEEWRPVYKACFADIKSEVAIPLLHLGELRGVINLESKKEAFFTREKCTYLEAVAIVAAGYLEYQNLSVELRQLRELRELEEAAQARHWHGLFTTGTLDLPGGSDLAGYTISRPCDAAIGGDFYDTVQIDSSTVGIILGDGEGHGAIGALHMLPIVSAFKAHARESRSTKHVLGKMLTAAREMHVKGTALYFIITKGRDGKWLMFGSAAGHPPLIVLRKGGYNLFPRQDLANLGMMGFLEETQMGEDIFELQHGDVIIACTDGIFEATNLPPENIELSMLGAVAQVTNRDPEAIARAVEQWALQQSGGRLADDATVVVLRVGRGKPQ